MKKLLLLCLSFCSICSYAQDAKSQKILEEGQLLYRLEKGSWYGTDHFMENLPAKRDSLGGYVSYEGDNQHIYTIFFSRFDPDNILVRYQFDELPEASPLAVDTLNKIPTQLEKELIALNRDARLRATENKEGFYTFYSNTSLNFIPVIHKKEKKVYVLTAPQQHGGIIIGNDYLLKYDKKGKFKSEAKIHESLIYLPYQSDDPENPLTATVHTHILGDLITATDICTLLLYQDYLEWTDHFVLSKNLVSIFNMKTENLVTMKRKDWDKMVKDLKED